MYSVAVMGPGSVGKSALTVQYVQGVFVKDYDPTIEDAYRKTSCVDDINVHLDILDTAGQEDFVALRSTWMRDRDGFVLVFALNARETFEDLQSFYDQLAVMHEDRMPAIVLVGNKSDLESDRQIKQSEAKKLAAKYNNCAYVETSAKTGDNIDLIFTTLVREIRKKGPNPDKESKKPAKSNSWCVLL